MPLHRRNLPRRQPATVLRPLVGQVEDLGQQYNAPELLSAYVHGLETVAQDAGKGRFAYASALKSAAAQAARHVKDRH